MQGSKRKIQANHGLFPPFCVGTEITSNVLASALYCKVQRRIFTSVNQVSEEFDLPFANHEKSIVEF